MTPIRFPGGDSLLKGALKLLAVSVFLGLVFGVGCTWLVMR